MYMSQTNFETPTPTIAMPWNDIAGECHHERRLNPHEVLFCEGDDAEFLYELVDGVMCNYRILSDGRRQVTSFAYPGDLVGLGNAIDYRLSCEAVCNVRVRCIPMGTIMRRAQEKADIGHRLLQCVSAELAHMQEHQILLGRKSAIEKLATFLLKLARRSDQQPTGVNQFQLPMTRTDIADFLGMTIETVSRNMSKLKAMGVIDLPQTTTVIVRDIIKLEELAGDEENVF